MKAIKNMLFSFIIITLPFILGSQNYYEIVIDTDSTDLGFSTFETNTGSYITLGNTSNGNQGPEFTQSPVIVSHTDSQSYSYAVFHKDDTCYGFNFGFQKDNGNYFIIGSLGDSAHPNYNSYIIDQIYLCELSPDFNLVWEKMYPIPEGYNLRVADFLIDQDNHIVMYSSLMITPYSNEYLFLTKFDMNGNLLCSNFLPDYNPGLYNEIILKPDSTGYYIIGEVNKNGILRSYFDIDTDLNLVATGPTLSNLFGYPFNAKWLSNGNLFIVNEESSETPGAYRDMQVRIVNQSITTTLKDTVFFDPANVYTPVHDGMDFIYEDLIWTCTFNEAIPYYPGNEVYTVYLFDSEMNMKGMKVFGGDSRWWFFHLMATTDGGCIITGIKREPGGTVNGDYDLCILKFMPEDIITSAEETSTENDRDVSIYPVPFDQFLTIKSAFKNLEITLYDFAGNSMLHEMTGNMNHYRINTNRVSKGFYFYKIEKNNAVIQTGKLLKN